MRCCWSPLPGLSGTGLPEKARRGGIPVAAFPSRLRAPRRCPRRPFPTRRRVTLGDVMEAGLVVEKGTGQLPRSVLRPDHLSHCRTGPARSSPSAAGSSTTVNPSISIPRRRRFFTRGAQVYGLRQARDGIRSNDRVVVVEGYLDVLALAQFGATHVVATLGTALTARSFAASGDGTHPQRHGAVRRRRRRAQRRGPQLRDIPAGRPLGSCGFPPRGLGSGHLRQDSRKGGAGPCAGARGADRGFLSEPASGTATAPDLGGKSRLASERSAGCSRR